MTSPALLFLLLQKAASSGGAVNPLLESTSTDATAPTLFGMSITEAERDTIALTLDDVLLTTPPAGSAFTLAGTLATAKTVVSVTIASNTVKVKFSSEFVGPDMPTLAYTAPGTNPIRNSTSIALASFAALRVANEIRYATPITARTSGTQDYTTAGGGAWVVKPASSGFAQIAGAVEDPFFAGFFYEDSWLECDADNSATKRGVWLDSADNRGYPTLAAYQVYVAGNVATAETTTGMLASFTLTGSTSGRLIRVRRTLYDAVLANGTILAEYSNDGGRTWTVFHTFATPYTETLCAYFYTNSTTVPVIPRAFNFEAPRS